MSDPRGAATESSTGGGGSFAPGGDDDHVRNELPFLVTHWLANYGTASQSRGTTGATAAPGFTDAASPRDPQQREAIERIRRATAEIASAFSSLGAYGSTFTFRVSRNERSCIASGRGGGLFLNETVITRHSAILPAYLLFSHHPVVPLSLSPLFPFGRPRRATERPSLGTDPRSGTQRSAT
jgi:hypothetical protein